MRVAAHNHQLRPLPGSTGHLEACGVLPWSYPQSSHEAQTSTVGTGTGRRSDQRSDRADRGEDSSRPASRHSPLA
eukprot:8190446-Alexandrium_andersonii.AAC.1